jgi:hypothetical protein
MKASDQNCALPVFPLGTSNVGVSLPHVRNGRFLVGTFLDPISLVGPIGDLRLKGWNPGSRTSIYPYVAPHTAKIHTPITLGTGIRTKPRRCLLSGAQSWLRRNLFSPLLGPITNPCFTNFVAKRSLTRWLSVHRLHSGRRASETDCYSSATRALP